MNAKRSVSPCLRGKPADHVDRPGFTTKARRVALLALAVIVATGAAPPAPEYFVQREFPVDESIERAYALGLQYLAESQAVNGAWPDGQGQQPGVAALALLSILAHGDDPNTGPYAQTVQRTVAFLLSAADPTTGYIGPTMYNHGFATLALAECYGAVDEDRIGPILQKAVDLILDSQKRNGMGAWRYAPDSRDADVTVSGAQMVALFAARNAGIHVPEEAIRKGLAFFRNMQGADGGFGYTRAGSSNPVRTAIGTLVLALARARGTPSFEAASRYLLDHPAEQGSYQFYFLYYASQAFFHADMDAWETWNASNARMLLANQESDGRWNDSQGQGPTFGTATALLSLAVNYRFLPIYER